MGQHLDKKKLINRSNIQQSRSPLKNEFGQAQTGTNEFNSFDGKLKLSKEHLKLFAKRCTLVDGKIKIRKNSLKSRFKQLRKDDPKGIKLSHDFDNPRFTRTSQTQFEFKNKCSTPSSVHYIAPVTNIAQSLERGSLKQDMKQTVSKSPVYGEHPTAIRFTSSHKDLRSIIQHSVSQEFIETSINVSKGGELSKIASDLQNNLESFSSKLDNINSENRELHQRLQKLYTANNNLGARCSRLQDEINAFKKENSSLRDKEEKYIQEIAYLKEMLQIVENQASDSQRNSFNVSLNIHSKMINKIKLDGEGDNKRILINGKEVKFDKSKLKRNKSCLQADYEIDRCQTELDNLLLLCREKESQIQAFKSQPRLKNVFSNEVNKCKKEKLKKQIQSIKRSNSNIFDAIKKLEEEFES